VGWSVSRFLFMPMRSWAGVSITHADTVRRRSNSAQRSNGTDYWLSNMVLGYQLQTGRATLRCFGRASKKRSSWKSENALGSPSLTSTPSQGAKSEAEQVLKELSQLSKRRYVSPYFPAMVYVGLGRKEQALRSLEKGYADHSMFMNPMKVDPEFDSPALRTRFSSLCCAGWDWKQ